MASTQTWSEGNGTNAGTETANRTDVNWKSVDDSTTTAYSNAPITAGSNSFTKYQAIKFGGTYNTLSGLSYFASTSAPLDNAGASGKCTLTGAVVTAGTTPATGAVGSAIATSAGVLTANFTSTALGYAVGSSTSSASAVVYGNALRTQLQVSGTAAPGDLQSAVTITAQWTES